MERKLVNGNGEAEQFYRSLPVPSLVGMESCGNSQWFLELVERLGHEVWMGDAAQIRASYVRKQKTDERDAAHILKLLMEGRFPRLWTPDAEVRDLRQLLIHRHRLVQIRTRVKNGLQHLAMNRGMQKKRSCGPKPDSGRSWRCRCQVGRGAGGRSAAAAAPTGRANHSSGCGGGESGVGPRAGAAVDDAAGSGRDHGAGLVLTIGDVSRFHRGKQVASYLGLIPSEHSSGGKQRLGAISKQGNSFVRMLLVEAATRRQFDSTKGCEKSISIAATARRRE